MIHQFIIPRMKRQEGVSLIVAMVFLIILSMLAIAAIRGVTMQERMAGNTQDWNLAFQAAEAALRDAEIDIRASGRIRGMEGFTNNCGGGLCLPSENGTPVWRVTTNWHNNSVAYGAITLAAPLPEVNTLPRYIIEALGAVGNNSLAPPDYTNNRLPYHAYRITAIGFGNILDSTGNPAIRVFTQSVFTN
ncbi:MAG: hypothetical protein LBI35_02210 [Burkholderiales bacterium]|jgi:type IV pilus assembly protein PilX|nr:hypothetical protein [Burkholderiales bacterium]